MTYTAPHGRVSATGDTPFQAASACAAADTVTGGAGLAAAITYNAAGAGICHYIGAIYYSYTAAPTGGALTITDNGTTIFAMDIVASGPGSVLFNVPKKGTANTNLVVTLAAPGGAVVGKLNVNHWTL